MKHTIILILILACSAFGQGEPPLMKGETLKARKERQKELRKAEEKQRKESAAKAKTSSDLADSALPQGLIDAVLERVSLFPADYDGKSVRFKNIYIGNLGTYSEGAETVYLLQVKSPEGKLFVPNLGTSPISFIMQPDLAKQIQAEYERTRKREYDYLFVNLITRTGIVTLDNGKQLFLAAVKCVQTLSYKSEIIKTIGNCGN